MHQDPSPQAGAASRRAVIAGLAAAPVLPAFAQFRVEVTGVGMRQIPIAIAPFRGEGGGAQQISQIIQADLERSGYFKGVGASGEQLDENSRPDLSAWRQRSVDNLVTGSVNALPGGRFEVRFRLWDVIRGQDLGGQSYSITAADLRLAAHRAADYIYEKITGEKGVFATRLAFVTRAGQRYSLRVSDSDGENAKVALASPEPIISPAWSPDGRQLAYVSFEARKPVVYVHTVASGQRRLLANFRGSNSAPAWSPDGGSIAVTLSRDGGSQLYVLNAQGGEPRRLTQSSSIDTEPVYSPDGQSIYFVSDRGGSPQIYRMPAGGGGGAQRATFNGNYNISPTLSADGRTMAFVSRVGGGFRLHVQDLQSGTVSAITDSSGDESPSFAPNGRLLVYATRQGRDSLMTTTLDGRIKTRLAGQGGEIREPAWGPFMNWGA